MPLAERAAYCSAAVDAMIAMKDEIVPELAWQMGRPVRYGAGELRGFEERARYMIGIAEQALADIDPGPKDGFVRYVRRDPLGVVFTHRAVELPLPHRRQLGHPGADGRQRGGAEARRLDAAGRRAVSGGIRPGEAAEGRVPASRAEPRAGGEIIAGGLANMVCFTGSVAGGKAMEEASAGRFINVGLELGGKDPAYVRPDANMAHAVENLVDGAFFNSGQSCCAHRADLRPQEGVGRLPRRLRRSDEEVRAGLAARRGDDARPHGEGRGGGVRPEADRVGRAGRRQGPHRPQGLPDGQGGHALHGARRCSPASPTG